MKVSFNGFNETVATFETETEIAQGKLVKMSANGTVEACVADDAFIGVTVKSESDAASVQLKGYAKLTYSGTSAPSVGYNKFSSDANGNLTVDTDGKEYLVIDVDTTAKTVGIML